MHFQQNTFDGVKAPETDALDKWVLENVKSKLTL